MRIPTTDLRIWSGRMIKLSSHLKSWWFWCEITSWLSFSRSFHQKTQAHLVWQGHHFIQYNIEISWTKGFIPVLMSETTFPSLIRVNIQLTREYCVQLAKWVLGIFNAMATFHYPILIPEKILRRFSTSSLNSLIKPIVCLICLK